MPSMTVEEFIYFIKGKKVLCFGAGIQGRRMIYYFENWGIEDSLLAYVDNSASKVGTHISGDHTSVPVISIDEMVRKWDSDTVIPSFLSRACIIKKSVRNFMNYFPMLLSHPMLKYQTQRSRYLITTM